MISFLNFYLQLLWFVKFKKNQKNKLRINLENDKLLSKNLDSKVIDEVQIIDNFEDNPIFKKLNKSDNSQDRTLYADFNKGDKEAIKQVYQKLN